MPKKAKLGISIENGQIILEVGAIRAVMDPAAAYIAGNHLLDFVDLIGYEPPQPDPEHPCPCDDCTSETTLTETEQAAFEALTANIELTESASLTYEELQLDRWRPAITEDGREINGFGVKLGLVLLKAMTPDKTEQELFEEQYGKVTWKDEK